MKESITFSEFLDWCEYLNWEERRQTKHDVYLAQIAAETRRSYVKHPRSVKTSDFILERSGMKRSDSKSVWLGLLNVNPKN